MDWGYQVTIHIYVEGEQQGDGIIEASQAACAVLEAEGAKIHFAGASTEPVAEQPKDQTAT